MRIILFTGKGGVGKSSMASAAAARAAALGQRTLLVSSDTAHNLGDIFDVPIGGGAPVELAPGLHALEVDVLGEIRLHWGAMQTYVAGLLAHLGMESAVAEEVALFPGLEDLFLLTRILNEAEGGEYDAVVVDCSPTAGTLRLLTLTDASASWLGKLLAVERRLLSVVRPLIRHVPSVGPVVPEDAFYRSLGTLLERVARLGRLLKDPHTSSVRLVLNPERLAIAESRRTYTYLRLFGFPVDAILVNKVFPQPLDGGYFGRWRALQQKQLDLVRKAFLDTPVLTVPYLDHEPRGVGELLGLGVDTYGDRAPHEVLAASPPVTLEKRDGKACITFPLPGLCRADLDVGSRGDEVFVRAGEHVRVFVLPDGLQGCAVETATYDAGELRLTFEPSEGDVECA